VIKENGKKRTVTKLEATIRRLIDNAICGDQHALRTLAALMPAEQTAAPVQVNALLHQPQ